VTDDSYLVPAAANIQSIQTRIRVLEATCRILVSQASRGSGMVYPGHKAGTAATESSSESQWARDDYGKHIKRDRIKTKDEEQKDI